ncbi:PAS domain S-box-containing protein [Catalinimonas alkaloidigena]|uniref:histidine kinase n=1 Tax=Catalinimonas alkaloidigena TaxID=1075417 RepID=A0A1G9BX25_9BACT|nr:PAS domain-containing protein [Catalinimonas alkaloidigena]SDK44028.1 PAS domain S-box-containing protein [Catalinimonas alkaloidigena]
MQAPVAIGIYLGEQHVIQFANPRMCEIWGRSFQQVINTPLFKALPEVSGQGFEEILADVYHRGVPFTGDELPATLQRNGKLELAYFNILYDPLRNEQNEVYGVLQTAIEVTELVEARKKAEYNEETLKVALEAARMGTFLVDFVHQSLTTSKSYDQIFGYADGDFVWDQTRFWRHVLPEDRPELEAVYQRGLQEGTLDFETRIRWEDGSLHWVQVKGKISFNLKGNPMHLTGIVMDITEQRQAAERERQLAAEQAARLEAERQGKILHDLFMHAPALICILNGPTHTFTLVNPLYQQLFPGRQLLGVPLLEALPELTGQPIEGIINQVYETGETFVGKEVPVELKRDDTRQLVTTYFNFVYQAMRDKDENVSGILVFAFDVTEQLLARKQIEHNAESLRLALEAGSMGTWDLDLVRQTTVRTIQHDAIFGYERLLDHWDYESFMRHVLPQYKEEVARAFQKSYASGELNFETRIQTIDNHLRWIAVRGRTFYQDAQPIRMAGVVMDITSRKRVEEQLQQLTEELASSNEELLAANEEIRAGMEELSLANKQLRLINADLDNFIYTASHDLKAPILNIEGLMKLLVRNLPIESLENQTVTKIMSSIDNSVKRFQTTIEELANITKLQRESEEPVLIEFATVVRDVLLDLQTQVEEAEPHIETHFEACQPLRFSYKNLKSVCYNLISNAIKYRAPERPLTISITCYQEASYQVLEVEDNGLGMKEENIPKVFSMFKRLHTHVEGSGVGLYLVKRIVDNAGGKVEVESEEGVGTTFRVLLPMD